MHKFLVYAALLIVVTTIVIANFSLPALTESSNSSDGIRASQEFRASVAREETYCELMDASVDCVCFGQKSAHILEHEIKKAYGYAYANQRYLARDQALSKC